MSDETPQQWAERVARDILADWEVGLRRQVLSGHDFTALETMLREALVGAWEMGEESRQWPGDGETEVRWVSDGCSSRVHLAGERAVKVAEFALATYRAEEATREGE